MTKKHCDGQFFVCNTCGARAGPKAMTELGWMEIPVDGIKKPTHICSRCKKKWLDRYSNQNQNQRRSA